jgi:hypothetical protein
MSKSPTRQFSNQSQQQQQQHQSEYTFISVKKWIDYSSKYGIGYALTNGSCGVYFNDSSKMLSFSDDFFYYI